MLDHPGVILVPTGAPKWLKTAPMAYDCPKLLEWLKMASKCQKFDNLLFRNTSQEREDVLFKIDCFFLLQKTITNMEKKLFLHFCRFFGSLDLRAFLPCPVPPRPADYHLRPAPRIFILAMPARIFWQIRNYISDPHYHHHEHHDNHQQLNMGESAWILVFVCLDNLYCLCLISSASRVQIRSGRLSSHCLNRVLP